jgi:hypothetical protein
MQRSVAASLVTACALAGAAVLSACAPTPAGVARVKAEQQAFYDRTFLPGAPKPGDPG